VKKIKKIWLWCALMNKAALKRSSFLIILASIPFLALGVNLMTEQDSGVLKIVLFQENSRDEAVTEILDKLMNEDSIISYLDASSQKEAEEIVQAGQADAAWIFHENFQEKLEACMAGDEEAGAFITIIEKEDNPILNLSTIKLFDAVYEACSYAMYSHFVTDKLAGGVEISEAELEQYYRDHIVEGNLFQLKYLDGEAVETEMSYLEYPVRGILSLVIVLCGLASCIFFMQDEGKGVFTWLPIQRSLLINWGYHMPVLLDTGLVVLVALSLTTGFSGWWWEIFLMLLYLLMVVGFCDVVRRLSGSVVRLGAMIPVLMLIMLVVCPIFMKPPIIKPLQLLLPPFYYLCALHSNTYVLGMIVYIVLVLAIDYLLLRYKAKRK